MSTIEELKLVHPWGKPLADIVKAKNPTRERVMLAFSLGKDSIMCWIWLEEHGFDVVPLYRYMVPGLSFVDEAVAYYEKKFGKRIAMVPHPCLVFETVEQRDEFLKKVGAWSADDVDHRFIDGVDFARVLGHKLSPTPFKGVLPKRSADSRWVRFTKRGLV